MTQPGDPPPVPVLRQKCPNCGKTATLKFKPFCSKRCADVDLGRWLNEEYRVPVEEGMNLEDSDYDDDL